MEVRKSHSANSMICNKIFEMNSHSKFYHNICNSLMKLDNEIYIISPKLIIRLQSTTSPKIKARRILKNTCRTLSADITKRYKKI